MPLNVANWTDKQLDELKDLLRSADSSIVAAFIAQNFLALGSRIMTDPGQTTLRLTVGSDPKTVSLSPGVFTHSGYVSQVDTSQIIKILDPTSSGAWGTGVPPDPILPRWDIVQIRWNEQLHTTEKRWFVDDSVVPNAYSQQDVSTLINKAYYQIQVKNGTPGVAVPPLPDPGFWPIGEIYIPPLPQTTILFANIRDTGTPAGSAGVPPNWVSTTRVLRLEFWSTLFGIDHDIATGFHKSGNWHIGSTTVLATGTELNKLAGTGGTVNAASLTKLTDGSGLAVGELHQHADSGGNFETVMGTSITLSAPVSQNYLCLCTICFSGFEGTQHFMWYKDEVLFEQWPNCMAIYLSGGRVTGLKETLTFHTVMPLTVGIHTIRVGWSGNYAVYNTPRVTLIAL